MSSVATVHDLYVASVAKRYSDEGYAVTLEPGDRVPGLPEGLQPDLVAVKGDEKLLIEVKGKSDRVPFERLNNLAAEARRTGKWKFLLVTEDDIVPAGTQESLLETPEPLSRVLLRVDRLLESHNEEGAFLTLWINLERTLREKARGSDVPADRLSFGLLIRQLYSEDELELDDFNKLLHLQKVRNQVVHGFRAEQLAKHREELTDLLKRLTNTKDSE